MTELRTTRYSSQYRPQPKSWTYGDHQLYHGAFEDITLLEKVDMAIFDTPSVDEDMTAMEYVDWFTHVVLDKVDQFVKPNAALALIPHDRKGSAWAKSDITAATVMLSTWGWKLFRRYVWFGGRGEFQRSHYAYAMVYIFRKGEMPTQSDRYLRRTDAIRIPHVEGRREDQDLGPLPPQLALELIDLFWDRESRFSVIDPFAGSGFVTQAALELGVESVAIELDPDRAENIRLIIRDAATREEIWPLQSKRR